jgi:hypothetical protein
MASLSGKPLQIAAKDMIMGKLAAISALLLACAILAGCQTGDSRGVLPRTATIAPPPSALSTEQPTSEKMSARAAPKNARVSVASDNEERSAPEPPIQPIMTGRGAGAGFRF